MPKFIRSAVRFDSGNPDEVLLQIGCLTPDLAHHLHQRQCARFWRGWRRVVGGVYQTLDATDAVGALVESAGLPPLTHYTPTGD